MFVLGGKIALGPMYRPLDILNIIAMSSNTTENYLYQKLTFFTGKFEMTLSIRLFQLNKTRVHAVTIQLEKNELCKYIPS